MLVVDASVAMRAVGSEIGFAPLGDPDLFAPPLMWSEARSALREGLWRGELSEKAAAWSLDRLEDSPIRSRNPGRLGTEAWAIADELGWAKTYDAEYLALARLLGCRVVTVDQRLRRGAARMELVVTPDEL